MTLHINRERWWTIVYCPSEEFSKYHKECINRSVHSLMTTQTIISDTPSLTVIHCTLEIPTGFTLILSPR